jgi:hypothetical protein
MKRSSARRARRWVIYELTRSLNQLSDTTASMTLSGDSNFGASGEKSSVSES